MKSKMEPATNRIKRLLEVLSSYSFKFYYIKGKDMLLSDFLSRQIEDDSNLHEITCISFNIQKILQESYHSMVTDTYNVQTRAQTKAQANTPTAVDTQPKTQKVTPHGHKIPSKTKEESNMKGFPANLSNNHLKALHCPQKLYFHLLVHPQISGHHQSHLMSKKPF